MILISSFCKTILFSKPSTGRPGGKIFWGKLVNSTYCISTYVTTFVLYFMLFMDRPSICYSTKWKRVDNQTHELN